MEFYDRLTVQIEIPGVTVERNRDYDDERAQNGGISLKYDSHFPVAPALTPEVLLEVGFARTTPNEPRDVTSWALERALSVGVDLMDNRATAVKCFNSEYTFVDKLQTICRRFRQYRDRNEEKDRPRRFLRHYYDLYKLLELERVTSFVGTREYEAYKEEKLRGLDAKEFAARTAFRITDDKTYRFFEKEFEATKDLMLSPGPTFKELMDRIRSSSAIL